MAPTTTAPSPAERRAKRAAAPAPGAAAQSNALPSWRSALVARLERSKRYPPDAGGVRGVAVLAFNVDRSGGVHNARIAKSSGSSALDREALALARRAQPLPPPPAELSGAQISVSVPLRYNMD
jgi:protein TonB